MRGRRRRASSFKQRRFTNPIPHPFPEALQDLPELCDRNESVVVEVEAGEGLLNGRDLVVMEADLLVAGEAHGLNHHRDLKKKKKCNKREEEEEETGGKVCSLSHTQDLFWFPPPPSTRGWKWFWPRQ